MKHDFYLNHCKNDRTRVDKIDVIKYITYIGCGKCMRGCPQQCITKGKPFVIHQEHCLHCGLCFENCPVQAIIRRGA